METLTFLFTDIEGSTLLLRQVGQDAYARVLADHHRLIRAGIAAHGGREIATEGDGFFVVFASASDGVAAVVEMQVGLGEHEWPAGEQIRVRMGLHCGEAMETQTGLVGFDVHRASRVAGVAHGGQVVLSETAAALVRNVLGGGTSLRDLGPHRLKDLGHPERLFQLQAPGLESEFPRLRSLDHPELANNLPARSATFIGRDRELAEVRGLVESSRLVTLTGAGGAGKTRLAWQVAAELLDGSGDGVWLVELAAVSDQAAVAAAIIDALGIAAQPGQSALGTLVDALASQETLIVLDNCEHLIDACADVVSAVLRSCHRVHVIATSREPVGVEGEAIYRVPSLSLPDLEDVASPERSDAVALFLERVRAQGVDLVLDEASGPLVASVCRRLDGMPLAIELAAARLRSLSLVDLEQRLDHRFRLLTGGSRGALPRQQTLLATVQWSYSLLSSAEQTVLRRFSVFVDGFDLEAVEAVCGLDGIDGYEMADLLASLVDKSLVVAEPRGQGLRYQLLETIRQFAAERLIDQPQEAAALSRAHLAYFLAVAEQAAPHLSGPDPGPWLRRLDTDQGNARRALENAINERGQTQTVLRLVKAMRRHWWMRSRRVEILAPILPVIERPEAREDPQLLGEALVSLTLAGIYVDLQTARRLAQQAVQIGRELDDAPLLVPALRALAYTYWFGGDAVSGLPVANESVQRAKALGDDLLLGESLTVCLACTRAVDPANTDAVLREAVACLQRTNDLYMSAVLRNNASVDALHAGDFVAAREHLERAFEAFEAMGVANFNVRGNLGMVLREEGQLDQARELVEDGLRISRRAGDRYGLGYSLLCLALIAGDQNDWRRAAELHGAAQSFLDQIGQPWLVLYYARVREASVDFARAALSEDQFQRAYDRGYRLNSDTAIRLALWRAEVAPLASD
jgi:predicted ATPase/class 3 adenylate cyclase